MKRPLRRHDGFTIMEVMLALIIASAGLVVLLTVVSQSMGVARMAKEYETARKLMALVELEAPLQLDEDFEEGVDGDSFDGEFSDYRWEREITLNGLEEDEVFLVTTRIFWKSREQEEVEEVQTMIHLPTAKKLGYIDEDATGRD